MPDPTHVYIVHYPNDPLRTVVTKYEYVRSSPCYIFVRAFGRVERYPIGATDTAVFTDYEALKTCLKKTKDSAVVEAKQRVLELQALRSIRVSEVSAEAAKIQPGDLEF